MGIRRMNRSRVARGDYPRERLSFYLIPLMIGMSGILFSRQFPAPWVRSLLVLLSVAASEFVIGNALARIPSVGGKPFLVLLGALLLIFGGAVATWDLSMDLDLASLPEPWDEVPERAFGVSRFLGGVGLFLGLILLFYLVLRREEQTERVARHFSSLADLMSEGFALLGRDGTITTVNKSLMEITGCDETQFSGPESLELARRLGLTGMMSALAVRGRGETSEYRLPWNRNGEERQIWVTGTPVYSARGDFVGALATFRDVTESHEMARRLERYTMSLQHLVEDRTQELRTSEERLRNLLMHMNEGFLTVDSSGRILFSNERFCAMVQRTPEDVIGRNISEFVVPDRRCRFLDQLGVEESGVSRPMRGELALRCSDGTEACVVAAIAPITREHESGGYCSIVVTDVAELKRVQAELEQRARELDVVNKELREFGRAKDAFLTTVGHELRTPLSTILGYLEMFRSGSLGDWQPDQKNAIEVVSRNAERLGSLVDEIIEFSRMQIRGIDLSLRLFSIEPVVQECVRSIEPQLARKGMSLHLDASTAPIMLWADRERVAQVLTILLSNAVKFSYDNTEVRVCAAVRPRCGVAISVIDQGIGVDPVHHKRIFEKFYQVDNSLSRRYEGAGIGLSVAKAVAEAHGGFIELESELGKGATFTLFLPGAFFDTQAPPEDLRTVLRAKRILFLGDGLDAEQVLARYLASCGCAPVRARSLHEGLRLSTEQPPDLVILPMVMEEVSGVHAVEILRRDARTANIPVVVLSERDISDTDVQRCVSAGAYLLYTPFVGADLARRVADALTGQGDPKGFRGREVVASGNDKNVLIVDADPELRCWLETSLRRRGIACFSVSDAHAAVGLVRSRTVRCLLLEWDAGAGRRKATRDLAELLTVSHSAVSPRIIAMTSSPDAGSLPSGIAGVLCKPFRFEEVLDVIESSVPGG